MKKGNVAGLFLGGWLLLMALVLACAPVAPAPTPTKAPAAAPTKAPEAIKPAAPTPTPPAAPTATPKPATLMFAAIQTLSESGVFLAIEKGYFKEQGIALEVTNFRSLADVIAPLATGQVDVAALPVSVPLLTAVDRGVDLKIVGGTIQYRSDWEPAWIVLRKDLAESGRVKTPADLKGMKVAFPSIGGLGDMIVQMMVEQAGLKPADVELVLLPMAEQVAAFGNKAIAAGWATEPFIVRGVQEGFSVRWIPSSQLFGGTAQAGFIQFGSTLLRDQELARRWMIAYLKGARDYTKALTTGQGREEVVKTLVKYTTITDPKLYDLMGMPYVDPNGQLDKKTTDDQYKWYVDKGFYKGTKSFADVIDLSYVEYAVQKLGKFP